MSSQPPILPAILLSQGPQLQTWGPLEAVEPLETGGAWVEGSGHCRTFGAPGPWFPGQWMLWVDDATLEVTVTADLMSTPVSMPENFSKAGKTLSPHSPSKNSYSKSPTSVKNPAQFRKSIL